jgi:hypothetical protein
VKYYNGTNRYNRDTVPVERARGLLARVTSAKSGEF